MKITYGALAALSVVVAITAAAFILSIDGSAAAGALAYLKPATMLAMATAPAADLDQLRQSVDKFMNGFEEFKAANDSNLKQRDVVLEEKLTRINEHLDKWEPLNQAITKQAEGQKAMQEQLDNVEKILKRPKAGGGKDDVEDSEYNAAFEHCLRRAPDRRDSAHVTLLNQRRNTLIKGDDAGAGYLLAPPDVNRDIIKDIIEMSPMRSLATVRTIGGEALKQPKRTAAAGKARRVGETERRTNTGSPGYGMLTFPAPEIFARDEVSLQMLEDGDYDLIAELRGEFVDQFTVAENEEFVAGSGDQLHAQGFLVAPGVADVPSGDATKLIGDGLINLWAALKSGYSARAVFTLNRKTIGETRKLKTTDGQYVWMPGLAGAVPNTLVGSNYVEFPDMPDIAAGSYPIAYGDFRRGYIIVDRVSISFQPDYTTGADDGVVIFRARKRFGGGVRQAEALKKLKIAAG